MSRLGLHMIVKDEAHVIERCLRSVAPLVDWWVVCDTGSSDGTQDLVRELLAEVPGSLLERPWVSFGHNRQEALEAARRLEHSRPGDHTLFIDADDELVDVPERLPELLADGYHLDVEYGATRYRRLAVVRLDRPWTWRGVLHEHLDLPGASLGHLAAPRILQRHEGARSLDPDTYLKDAAVLQAELLVHPDDPRTQFYLAQSWRDAGEPERALAAYRLRAANAEGWEQERFYAWFQVAVLLERLGRPTAEVMHAYLDAHQQCAWRVEPLVELARHQRSLERYDVALLFARAAVAQPPPDPDALFVDTDAAAWRAWDELAIACYWTGRYAEGAAAAERALAASPDDVRLQDNLRWCREGLAAGRVE